MKNIDNRRMLGEGVDIKGWEGGGREKSGRCRGVFCRKKGEERRGGGGRERERGVGGENEGGESRRRRGEEGAGGGCLLTA
jgi:hypothetical protein